MVLRDIIQNSVPNKIFLNVIYVDWETKLSYNVSVETKYKGVY